LFLQARLRVLNGFGKLVNGIIGIFGKVAEEEKEEVLPLPTTK